MKEPIEPGHHYIEDVTDLFLNLDNLKFSKVEEDPTYEEYKGDVHDLVVEDIHNYQTEIGIAHNGGGK